MSKILKNSNSESRAGNRIEKTEHLPVVWGEVEIFINFGVY